MACKKSVIYNTGSTIIYFNYTSCDDSQLHRQVPLEPRKTKNVWYVDGTLNVSTETGFSIDDLGNFPPEGYEDYCCNGLPWGVVEGGEGGDGTVIFDYNPEGYYFWNMTGPNDGDSDGWVYIKKFFEYPKMVSINYEWNSLEVPPTFNYDRPFYYFTETEPIGRPTDTASKVTHASETGTWEFIVPQNTWLAVGIYSVDTFAGPGLLNISIKAC